LSRKKNITVGYCAAAIPRSLIFVFFASDFRRPPGKAGNFLGRDLNSIFLHCYYPGHGRNNRFCSTIPADVCPGNHHWCCGIAESPSSKYPGTTVFAIQGKFFRISLFLSQAGTEP
jgi:hypothetical protein